MLINVKSINFREAFDYIDHSSEMEIRSLDKKYLIQLFNKAIQYLGNHGSRLQSPDLLSKFIQCIPSECAKHPQLHKALSFLRDVDAFYDKSLWKSLWFGKTVHPQLNSALEQAVIKGNEAIAVELIEHGLPCSLHILLMACELGRDKVLQAISGMGLFDLAAMNEIIPFFSETVALALLKHHFPFTIETLAAVYENQRDGLLKALIHKIAGDGKKTILHQAAKSNRINLMRIIAKELPLKVLRAELNRRDKSGCCPLEYAIKGDRRKFNKMLVEVLPEIAEDLERIAKKLILANVQNCEMRKAIKKAIPNSKLLPDCKSKEEWKGKNVSILLLGKNMECLEEAWTLISAYTKQVDPAVKIGERRIKVVTDLEDIRRDFTHYITIDPILPRPVRAIYGTASFLQDRNCHGAALVASGIHPSLDYIVDPYWDPAFREKSHEVPLEELKLGDFVYISEGPPKTHSSGRKGAHSFIYLSHNLCLSMNGMDQKLKFFQTQYVLNMYGFPETVLDASLKDDPLKQYVKIFRKNDGVTYPEQKIEPSSF